MVDASYASRVYEPYGPYVVGREKIREFATAVAATRDIHHDVTAARSAGFRDLVAPTTFPVIIAQQAEAQLIQDPAAGIDFSRVVHANERFVSRRPLVAGDHITTVLTVESITERAGLAMVTTRCDLYEYQETGDSLGELVTSVYSTLAVRGA